MLRELKMLAPQELPVFSQWRSQEGLIRNAGGKPAGFRICMNREATSLCMIHEATSLSTLLHCTRGLVTH